MKREFFLIPALAFIFTCSLQAGPFLFLFSGPTDHFRSVLSGDWAATTTWESSPDNITWAAATLVPTSAANTISIRNTHTVTVNTNESMDQLIIENGGILLHASNTLTVNDGTGDDIIVQAGGIFTLSSNGNGPVFLGSATANINTGGILRLSATGLTNAGTGVHASNYIYSNASVLEYSLIFAFSTSGVTYFPNANAATIPVFRITNNVAPVGANTFTVINGVFEANGNISFQNTGTKTFRNGITGTGNVNGSTSGKFMINGATASLGGAGLLTVPATDSMVIGPNSVVTMISDKSITGNISLWANALVMLGNYDLTMTGDIGGGSATSHIVTNSTGKLVINNIVGLSRIFPIGANTTTINPLSIFNGLGLNYGARVETGINPSIRFPVAAINRTWVVRPSGTPGAAVNVNFFYNNTAGNALFNYAPATVEQGFYTGVWNVINTGLTQFGGPVNFQVTTTVGMFAANTDAPMVLANIPAILEGNNSVQLTALKQNDKTILNWIANSVAVISKIIPERSADGRIFKALTELSASDLSFTDRAPLAGLNYYRVQVKDKDGKISFSNIALIRYAQKGFELISITPNPVVSGNLKLNISSAERIAAEILITDMQGRFVQKQRVDLIEGSSTIEMNLKDFAAGSYQVFVTSDEARSKVQRFVKR